MMPDREKVIKGMKMCISSNECSPDDCPYYIRPNNESGLCWDRLMTDALALLKEQEPRLLKPEEFAGTYRYCWLEAKASNGRSSCGIADICVGDDGVNYEAQFIGTSQRGFLPHDLLGSCWRCWSTEPTEEQRDKMKWE